MESCVREGINYERRCFRSNYETGYTRGYYQIETKEYKTELEQAGIKNILLLGMSFCGKDVVVVSKQI